MTTKAHRTRTLRKALVTTLSRPEDSNQRHQTMSSAAFVSTINLYLSLSQSSQLGGNPLLAVHRGCVYMCAGVNPPSDSEVLKLCRPLQNAACS
ncbi:hypothetical protein IG631_13722 [Alternaria alternata]|nr:hypothetical protein IG631_13722 [Alternaria alternata]